MNCMNCYFQDNGRCRRYPPTPVLTDVDGTPIVIPEWVLVSEDDWCGEFLKDPT